MENQSQYDPTRKTVGAIYRDAQMASHDKFVENGDLTNVMQSSLVEDLNDTINSKPYEDKAYYITVHEKKDLTMPRAILRRIITTLYRPYPEDDTIVFWVAEKALHIKFCWCLPHWSEMDNMLDNHTLYNTEMMDQIRSWKSENLYNFGFAKDEMGNWIANPNYKDKEMVKKPVIIR